MSHRFPAAGRSRPPGWGVLVADAVARQAASPTAAAQARLAAPEPERGRFAPADGRFCPAAASMLAGWKEE